MAAPCSRKPDQGAPWPERGRARECPAPTRVRNRGTVRRQRLLQCYFFLRAPDFLATRKEMPARLCSDVGEKWSQVPTRKAIRAKDAYRGFPRASAPDLVPRMSTSRYLSVSFLDAFRPLRAETIRPWLMHFSLRSALRAPNQTVRRGEDRSDQIRFEPALEFASRRRSQ